MHTRAHILGSLNDQPRVHKPETYFLERDIWLDCRAPNCLVIDAEANLGWNIAIVTLSHDPRPGYFGRTYGRLVRVDAQAFVAGFSILYNTHIGEGAVVAVGSVVRSMDVAPWTMVAGNPARVVMRYDPGQAAWIDVKAE